MSLGMFSSTSECAYVYVYIYNIVSFCFFSHRSFIGCRHNDWETIITKQQLLFITMDEAKRIVKLNRALLIFLTRELSKAIVRRYIYPIDLRYGRICWQINILLKEKKKKKEDFTTFVNLFCSVFLSLSLSLSLTLLYDWMLAHTYTY